MGFYITLCIVHTTQGQGQVHGIIVFYCAHPVPCPGLKDAYFGYLGFFGGGGRGRGGFFAGGGFDYLWNCDYFSLSRQY